MVCMTVGDIVGATRARPVCGAADVQVTGVAIDSRMVEPGGLFVCFPGERVDGNDYVAGALGAGAAAVVMTREPEAEVLARAGDAGAALLVAEGGDAEEFMLRLAGAWRARNSQWIVVGVTGSVGKTTTKDMLAAALATRYRVHATEGNHNNLIGLPLTLLSASADDEVVVAEMGMNHAGELARLSACGRPTVAVITNVGTSHIGNLGSREAIARAKAEILSSMQATDQACGKVRPCLVMTSDNDYAPLIEDEYARPRDIEVLLVGASEHCAVRAANVTLGEDGCAHVTATCSDGWGDEVTLPMPGRHVVSDFLLALAISWRVGADRTAACAAMASMPQTHMRMEVATAPGRPRVIDDSYNASPNSTAAALDVLSSLSCDGRRVAVLGEVAELGEAAPRLHGYIGAYAAAKPLDLLVLVGTDDADRMAEAALTMGFSEDRLERVRDVDEAIRVIAPIVSEGDLVLVKASRAARLDAFVREVLA